MSLQWSQVLRRNSFLADLKECCRTRNLQRGKELHAEVAKSGEDGNTYIAGTLINMYSKCGCMVDARRVFDNMKHPSVVSWTVLILGYAENGQGLVALDLFKKMRNEGPAPDSVTLVAALKSCISLSVNGGVSGRAECRKWGKQIHDLAVEIGCYTNAYVRNTLIAMYAKCGCMPYALQVFNEIKDPDVVSWNVLILGYADSGQARMALNLFAKMENEKTATDSLTFVAAVKACSSLAVDAGGSGLKESKDWGKRIHKMAVERGCFSDVFVQSSLIDMYAKCGSVTEARQIFNGIKHPDVVSWRALVLGYAESGQGVEALELFNKMVRNGPALNAGTLIAAIKACSSAALITSLGRDECRAWGKHIHDLAESNGCFSNVFLQTGLMEMYFKCGSAQDARLVFDNMKHPDVVAWTALIMGYTDTGQPRTALEMFSRMKTQGGPLPDAVTFVAALKACTILAASGWTECRKHSKEIHDFAVERGFGSNIYVRNTLMNIYAKCGNMADALMVFETIRNPDVVSWNVVILGYAESGDGHRALDLFNKMRDSGCVLDSGTFVAALKACTSLTSECRSRCKEIHDLALKSGFLQSDISLQNTLIDVYSKCNCMDDALHVFERMKRPDIVSWTSLIMGYADSGEGLNALDLFRRLKNTHLAPDAITFIAALKACTALAEKGGVSSWEECINRGKEILDFAIEKGFAENKYVQNTLIDMFAKCGCMVRARQVFDSMKQPDVVSWNALILGYAENEEEFVALELFYSMNGIQTPVSFVAAFKACSSLGMRMGSNKWMECRERGKKLHDLAIKMGCFEDVFVQNTVIDMYAKCGSMIDAHQVFDSMKPDAVSWNVLIMGYAENGQGRVAVDTFRTMRSQGLAPNSVTFVAALKACSVLGELDFGRTIHVEINAGNHLDAVLLNCLVEFYARCGSIQEAQNVFNTYAGTRVTGTWNALLAGLTTSGDHERMFKLFDEMQDAGFQADAFTFISILTCCSHAGLVEKGKEFFEAMTTKYGTVPMLEHYTCMADIFGRAKKLDDAMALLQRMPWRPTEVIWTTVLGACSEWKNVEVGRLAFQSWLNVSDRDPAAYVLMGQIYGSKGMSREADMVMGMQRMKDL